MSSRVPEKMRRAVAERAGFRCEYCHLHQDDAFYNFQADHVISLKHGGPTTLDNLAFPCPPCNGNKGSDLGTVLLPNEDLVRLFNPRKDVWEEHLYYDTAVLYAKTLIGEATIKILEINKVERIMERQIIPGFTES